MGITKCKQHDWTDFTGHERPISTLNQHVGAVWNSLLQHRQLTLIALDWNSMSFPVLELFAFIAVKLTSFLVVWKA